MQQEKKEKKKQKEEKTEEQMKTQRKELILKELKNQKKQKKDTAGKVETEEGTEGGRRHITICINVLHHFPYPKSEAIHMIYVLYSFTFWVGKIVQII